MVDGFNNGGPGGVTLLYKGPDTEGNLKSVPSVDAAAQPAPPASHFRLRIWASPNTLVKIPTDLRDLSHVGDAVISELAFSGQNAGTLAQFVSNTPAQNFAWQVWGKLQVYRGGEYRFCSLSIDGSKVYIDSELVVNNDGVSVCYMSHTTHVHAHRHVSTYRQYICTDIQYGMKHTRVSGYCNFFFPHQCLHIK